jgi:hypothetical protein
MSTPGLPAESTRKGASALDGEADRHRVDAVLAHDGVLTIARHGVVATPAQRLRPGKTTEICPAASTASPAWRPAA